MLTIGIEGYFKSKRRPASSIFAKARFRQRRLVRKLFQSSCRLLTAFTAGFNSTCSDMSRNMNRFPPTYLLWVSLQKGWQDCGRILWLSSSGTRLNALKSARWRSRVLLFLHGKYLMMRLVTLVNRSGCYWLENPDAS